MGFGDTAKKLQKVSSVAEDLYEKVNQLRGQIQSLREEVATTSEQVDDIERDLAEQRVLLEALAEEQGLDVEALVADAHIEDADEEADAVESPDGDGNGVESETATDQHVEASEGETGPAQ